MFKYILEGAGDINWMAIFALLTFFFIFIVGAATAFFSKSDHINRMASMPLDDSKPSLTAEISDRHEK
jgi:hypothetical protein